MTLHKQKVKNPNLKLFKLLNDEIFWHKLTNICLKPSRITTLRQYRSKNIIPSKKVLTNFINEDYKFIYKDDNRETRDIILDLLSE